jgi:hypothetical protein
MKTKTIGIKVIGSFVAAIIMATIPLSSQAVDIGSGSSSRAADKEEIRALKHQLHTCLHHKNKRKFKRTRRVATVIEKQVIVEKPVYIDRERIVEKQVFVDRPATTLVEKEVVQQVVLAAPMERRVIVEHAKHKRHLLHLAIPFIGVHLF